MESIPVVALGLMLLTASLVAMISRRLNLPYSAGLVVAGAGLAIAHEGIVLPLSRELIFTVFLPPLVFEAALQLKWREFRGDLPVTLLLAFPGVAIAAGVVAVGAQFLLHWSWTAAGLFGVLIAATDPVSVIAAFREMKVQPRLSMLVESESLLNDGAAAVGFAVVLAVGAGTAGGPLEIAGSLIWTVVGGVGFGAAVSGALLVIAGRTDDHLVEITLTTIAAYGSFLAAEHFAMSGVLASMTAGIMVGNVGWRGAISERGRGHLLSFWEYAAFLANSVVFLLIGGQEATQSAALLSAAAGIAILLVLFGRAMAVYPLCALLSSTRLRVEASYQHVLVWGGLRGALALALALGIPLEVPERSDIIRVAFAVVAFSIFVQGLTMPRLITRLGLRKP